MSIRLIMTVIAAILTADSICGAAVAHSLSSPDGNPPTINRTESGNVLSLFTTPPNCRTRISFCLQDTLGWEPPRFDERQEERNEMVREQIKNRGINEREVLDAMRHVPRHLFVPRSRARNAYKDRPLPIGHGQTISQPYIVAYMTRALELDSTDKVLEIGTGSGYQAAVLSELTPHVFTIEIIDPLASQAKQQFEELGYRIIETMAGDGYYGWEQYAPFDAIIVTAAAGHIPSPLIQQLKPDGTMVIPVGGTYDVQKLMKVHKTEDDKIRTQSLMPVRFVPMTGAVREQN